MNSIGIMQGRLTPTRGRGIQFFPFDNWENEFIYGATIGLDEIEWIFDYDDYSSNPVWTEGGCKRILSTISNTGVVVRSLCFDYFMRRPFFRFDHTEKNSVLIENKTIMLRILDGMKRIGADVLEIPLVDNSSLRNTSEEKEMMELLIWTCERAGRLNIVVDIESDYEPPHFAEFLRNSGLRNLYANYDSGNSSGLGYDHQIELRSLGGLVNNVHIKDRIIGGGTVALGTGNADFDKVFGTLKEIEYDKSIILQAARGIDGKELNNISSQVEFVKSYMERYGL